MGMNYCPFCGSQLVENAKFCSQCGKPVPGTNKDEGLETEQQVETSNDLESKEMRSEPEPLHTIKIGEYDLQVAESVIAYNKVRSHFVDYAEKSQQAFESLYDKEVHDFEGLYSKALPAFLDRAADGIQFTVSILEQYGLTIESNEFLLSAQDGLHFDTYLKDYIDLAEQLEDFTEQLSNYRANNRSRNIQWQGGGFGLKGAIGGAMMAGALNIATDAVRGIGHSIVDSADRARLKKLQIDLYNARNHKEFLSNKLRSFCIDLFDPAVNLLEDHGLIVHPPFDIAAGIGPITEAFDLVDNPDVRKEDYEKALELTLRGMPYDPYFPLSYLTLYKIPFIKNSDVLKIVRFFGIEDRFAEKIAEYEKDKLTNFEAMPEETIEAIDKKLSMAKELNNELCYAHISLDKLTEKREKFIGKYELQETKQTLDMLVESGNYRFIWEMADGGNIYAQQKIFENCWTFKVGEDAFYKNIPFLKEMESQGSKFAEFLLAYYRYKFTKLSEPDNVDLLKESTNIVCKLADEGLIFAMARRGIWGTFRGKSDGNIYVTDPPEISLNFLRVAAEHHVLDAMIWLSYLYKDGSRGVPQDLTKSYEYQAMFCPIYFGLSEPNVIEVKTDEPINKVTSVRIRMPSNYISYIVRQIRKCALEYGVYLNVLNINTQIDSVALIEQYGNISVLLCIEPLKFEEVGSEQANKLPSGCLASPEAFNKFMEDQVERVHRLIHEIRPDSNSYYSQKQHLQEDKENKDAERVEECRQYESENENIAKLKESTKIPENLLEDGSLDDRDSLPTIISNPNDSLLTSRKLFQNLLEISQTEVSDNKKILGEIKALCAQFLANQDPKQFLVSDELIIGLGIDADDIYLAHDDTWFKSGKNGFAITSSGIYCRNIMERESVYTTYDELKKAKEVYRKSDYTYADKALLSYYTGDKYTKEDIKDLFQAIWELLQ